MSWSNSKIFVATIEDCLESRDIDLAADGFKIALYNDTPVPDQTVTSANTAYNVGQWVNTNEQSDGTNWDAGGEPLTTVTFAPTSNVLKFDADNTPQGGASCTLANVYGGLVYDTTTATVTSQGICYLYFGGVQSVTAGSFTVVYNASNGIFQLTL